MFTQGTMALIMLAAGGCIFYLIWVISKLEKQVIHWRLRYSKYHLLYQFKGEEK